MASDIPRAFDERDATNLLSVIADIREKSGLGAKPMLSELADAVARAIIEAEAKGAERQWQPIETAPRDGSWIEVFCPSYIVNPVRPAQFIHDVGLGEDIWGYAGDGYEYPVGPEAPTHWQPLPAPPSIRNLEAKDGNPSS